MAAMMFESAKKLVTPDVESFSADFCVAVRVVIMESIFSFSIAFSNAIVQQRNDFRRPSSCNLNIKCCSSIPV